MKQRPANRALIKARPTSGRIVAASRRQLVASPKVNRISRFSPQCGDDPKAAMCRGQKIVVSPIRRCSMRCVGIVSALRTQMEWRHASLMIMHALRAQLNDCAVKSGGLCNTTALTPALSPRRGGIVRRLLNRRKTVVARRASKNNRTANCCSLSPRERVRVRASVRTNCGFHD